MFSQLGSFASLLTQGPKLREEMGKLQQRLGQLTAEGTAGGGTVTVRANGRLEVIGVTLAPEALKEDRELLEDLIRGATNQALDKAREFMGEEMAKLASTLGIPAGMLGGLSGLLGGK